ncbi:MAG: TetR/AcrR family transcriptional regulator [Prolixibacteraceae bacterium]|nr:TetR/AcrR family transcriptional regulator [Prolixibacteraceae bacterium]
MDKQEQILKAALKLFVEFGFHGTPTSRIAQEAGVSNGTLFHYYKTKDELVVALYIYIKSNLAACMSGNRPAGETIKATFKREFIATLYWAKENPMEFRFTQQFLSSPYLSMISIDEIKKQTKHFFDLMQEAIDARVLKPLPLDLLFTLLSSHISGINQYLITSNLDAAKEQELIQTSFDLVWDMIT